MTVTMEPERKWTDGRLDDLNKKVEEGFGRVDTDIRELRAEMKNQGESLRGEIQAFRTEMIIRFEKIDRHFETIDQRFEAVEGRFHTVYVVIVGSVVSLAGVVFAGNALP